MTAKGFLRSPTANLFNLGCDGGLWQGLLPGGVAATQRSHHPTPGDFPRCTAPLRYKLCSCHLCSYHLHCRDGQLHAQANVTVIQANVMATQWGGGHSVRGLPAAKLYEPHYVTTVIELSFFHIAATVPFSKAADEPVGCLGVS